MHHSTSLLGKCKYPVVSRKSGWAGLTGSTPIIANHSQKLHSRANVSIGHFIHPCPCGRTRRIIKRTAMPDVIFPGPEGRLEGRFSPPPRPRAPVALILHPHPQGGGTMNDRITQALYKTFVRRGFATLRFNFRGVGRSQGVFDNGIGELSDAASALDWVQSIHPEAQTTWIAGFSFGAWIGMQLLMRRPEIRGFISVAPPANMYDFTFLAPCPSSGIIVNGLGDEIVTSASVVKLVEKLRTQKGITVHHDEIPKANHFFEHELEQLMKSVDNYLDMRLAPNSPIR